MIFPTSENIGGFGTDLLINVASVDRSSLHFWKFSLAGLLIDAWFSDPRYRELCRKNLADPIYRDTGRSNNTDVSLFLLDSESLGWQHPPRWPEDVFSRKESNVQLHNAGLCGSYLHDPRVWQFFSKDLRLGVQLIRKPGALPPWESGSPLRNFLHWTFSERARRLCHCATLGIDGKGILLAGAGGSGKSGTTLAGISAGMKTTGDDYCLVELSDRITAFPLFRILKQDITGVTRVPGISATEKFGPLNWQQKFEIHESELGKSPFVPELDIRAIAVLRIAGASKSVFRRASPGLALRAFAPSSSFQLPDGEAESIGFAGMLCRQVPCLELQLSENSTEIAETIRNFINRELA